MHLTCHLLARICNLEMTILCGYNIENCCGATCGDFSSLEMTILCRETGEKQTKKNQQSLNQHFSENFIYLVKPKTNLLSKTTINERTY